MVGLRKICRNSFCSKKRRFLMIAGKQGKCYLLFGDVAIVSISTDNNFLLCHVFIDTVFRFLSNASKFRIAIVSVLTDNNFLVSLASTLLCFFPMRQNPKFIFSRHIKFSRGIPIIFGIISQLPFFLNRIIVYIVQFLPPNFIRIKGNR